ncbi:hypothetical protein ECO9602_01132 [Escherichia coli O111:H8 str. CVM9602]|nr:hypothetical protein ECO9602_01132 [Escherichia coli O111:H8 str. CVM9602]
MMVLMLPMKRSDNYLLVVIYHLPEVTLTQMEFTIMGYMVSGYNPYQIAEVLDMDIRSIYAYKQRIEKRMGGKINELFIRSHSVQH